MCAASNILHEPVFVDINSLEITAGRIICSIKRRWAKNKLNIKKLAYDDHLILYNISVKDTNDEKNSVLLKIYPKNSDVYTDYEEQLHLITQVIPRHIGPHIILTFTNGYFCSSVQGHTLDIKEQKTQ